MIIIPFSWIWIPMGIGTDFIGALFGRIKIFSTLNYFID
jgi:hypothetical protein